MPNDARPSKQKRKSTESLPLTPATTRPKPSRRPWIAAGVTSAVAITTYLVWGRDKSHYDPSACARAKDYARADLARWSPALLLPSFSACLPTDPDVAAIRDEWATKTEAASVERAAIDAARAKEREANLKEAAKVWAAYDALPSAKKTKEALLKASGEAMEFERCEYQIDRDYIARNNASASRGRMARFFNAKSRTSGDWNDTLIPSDDRVECLVWGSQWSKEAESLTSLGFKRLWCAASTVTGEPVREWIIE